MIRAAVGAGVGATAKVLVTSTGVVITVVSVAVEGAARGDVNAVVAVVDAVAVRTAVSVTNVAVRLAGSDAVIGVASGESGDS